MATAFNKRRGARFFEFGLIPLLLLTFGIGQPKAVAALSLNPDWIVSDSLTTIQATLSDGYLVSTTSDTSTVRTEINRQLHFLVGQLNAQLSAPAFGFSLKVQIKDIVALPDSTFEIYYEASFTLGWDANQSPPDTLDLALPISSDTDSIELFYETYANHCGLPFDEGPETFFFYFRPFKEGCTISEQPNPKFVVWTLLQLKPVDIYNSNSAPAYKSIWQDNRLVVTAVFGKLDSGFPTGAEDFYKFLEANYGPTTMFIRIIRDDFIFKRGKFSTPAGELDVRVFEILKGDITTASSEFVRHFKRSSKDSEFISYNGHAGYGKKVRHFTELIDYSYNTYKILYLNGCDTFTYLHESMFLFNTPLDFITTGLSSYFGYMSQYNLEIIEVLLQQKLDYAQLLKLIDVGSPSVLGKHRINSL